jgi:hypothetical protein
MAVLVLLSPFCVFYLHFVYFTSILCILPPFCIFCGNLGMLICVFPTFVFYNKKIWQPRFKRCWCREFDTNTANAD